MIRPLTVFEICAGAGGQALGLEQAGFVHIGAVELDPDACRTLTANRKEWVVHESDLRSFYASVPQVDLLAGGVPCPPFSIAGKQLGANDERDLFPEALRLVKQIRPHAVMLENVRGLATEKFSAYREGIISKLNGLGYKCDWRVLNASDFGVPQLRPRFILVALSPEAFGHFSWPGPTGRQVHVGEVLNDLMGANGWKGAAAWAENAMGIGPTIVGGSKKHGGPDLGPTRARAEWLKLGVDGKGIANAPPSADHPVGTPPRLTLNMVARVQGFPDEWRFTGLKTATYRQIGNAFPPPVACAVGNSIRAALVGTRKKGQ